MRINDAIRKAVVFLGIVDDKESFVPYGTGFVALWPTQIPGGYHIYLVTAHHVLKDIKSSKRDLIVRIDGRDGNTALGRIAAVDEWILHATNPLCDIAVIPFVASPETFDFKGVDLTKNAVSAEFIEKYDMGLGDAVFTAGLLTRHFGISRNISIVRNGNIAAMPDEPVDLGDLGQQEVYLIENRSIGGLSGSPVFLSAGPRVRKGMFVIDSQDDIERLLGVNIGLFQVQPSSDRARTDEADRRDHFLELMSSGIAVVVPVERVIEIIRDTPKLIEHRKKQLQASPPQGRA
ncbi:hypothetical protein ACN2CC_31830 [Mesorhizobium muleiense]|uniref:hypothetical protein n=1 Tax=Mesorhizobium muleiense TaxID=1004279 RepID=UPI003AFAECDE